MPPQPQQQQELETLNVKLAHFTKQNSIDEPVQVAFSVTDEQGKEIITGEIPYTHDLFPPIPGERLAEHSPFDSGETATRTMAA